MKGEEGEGFVGRRNMEEGSRSSWGEGSAVPVGWAAWGGFESQSSGQRKQP